MTIRELIEAHNTGEACAALAMLAQISDLKGREFLTASIRSICKDNRFAALLDAKRSVPVDVEIDIIKTLGIGSN